MYDDFTTDGIDSGLPGATEPEVGQIPTNDVSADDLDNVNKTGTTTVGLVTADGVVIATDMRASLGGRFVSNKNVQKVEQIHDTAALTLVGSVGGAQSFIKSLRAEANLYEARRLLMNDCAPPTEPTSVSAAVSWKIGRAHV